jgi:crossover junction endodeoxyribonuclease RuvC
MRILGIDPGTRLLGYAVVDALPRLRYVECGVVTAPARQPLAARLAEIQRALEEIIAELRPDEVAVEDVFTAHNARSALALGHARGVALAAAGRAGLPVTAYAPAKVKRAVTGRGAAPKEQVALMVRALVGLRMVPRADAADALAVAVAHAHCVSRLQVAIGAMR